MKRIDGGRAARLPAPELEVRDLRLVLALRTAGTTARAAELLHLAQPSVSRALLSLEDRLGQQLFERTPHGLTATAAGERIAERAGGLLDELGQLERSVREPKRVTRVRVVCECYTAYHWLPYTLTALRERVRGADLSLSVEHTFDALPALRDGKIDAALLTSPCDDGGGLRVAELFADELVFLVASDHPLAKKQALTPDDLCEHPIFTARATPHEARWFVSTVFGRARPRLDVTNVPLVEAIVDLARAGLGIALVTEWSLGAQLSRGGCVLKRLTIGPLMRPWSFAWRSELGDVGPSLHEAILASYAADVLPSTAAGEKKRRRKPRRK